MPKHHGVFHCLNCFRSFATKTKRESHKEVCEKKDFCKIIVPSENTKILEFNQYQKFDDVPYIIYEDLECLIEKIKGTLSGLRQFLVIESPLKMMKNFYFTSKAFFVLKIFKFLS